jgi:hypothetical protein
LLEYGILLIFKEDAKRALGGIEMDIKQSIKSQYRASLEMLRQAMMECPESLWNDPAYQVPFWHIAYHVLFFTHLYLQPSEDNFMPWEKHKEEYVSLSTSGEKPEMVEPFHKEDLLEYHRLCCEQVEERVSALDLEAESGFHWLPFDKLELQIYNIRHIQQHTGELYERLGTSSKIELSWVGMKA